EHRVDEAGSAVHWLAARKLPEPWGRLACAIAAVVIRPEWRPLSAWVRLRRPINAKPHFLFVRAYLHIGQLVVRTGTVHVALIVDDPGICPRRDIIQTVRGHLCHEVRGGGE